MNIITVVGARPSIIKVIPDLPQRIVHTGQHYDYEMSEIFFEGLSLPKPTWNLGCKNDMGSMLNKLISLFSKEKPDMVVVIGDTTSTLAGALAAAMCKIKIAHIESGLRSYTNMPEEINRVLTDRLATIRFCPNAYAEANLLKEGIRENVFVVGDPSFDTFGTLLPIRRKKWREYSLLTVHRDFNTDNEANLRSIIEAVGKSGEKFIFPCHPRTRKMIRKFKIEVPNNIKLKKPVSYKKSIDLISNAEIVVTDSGGVQRESFWMGVPVVILRNETEWVDIVSRGAGILVGSKKEKIIEAITSFHGKVVPPPEFGARKKIKEIIYRYV